MSGFSAAWLALREAADHRSRSPGLASAVRNAFAGAGEVRVVDLGCGTGSNLRATSSLLPERQHWTLVDYDGLLLEQARTQLARWGESCEHDGDEMVVRRGGHLIRIAFRRADANRDLDGALGEGADLVTASAFFDLCSAAYMQRFAQAVAARRARLYTVLTYNGEQRWTPPHPADADMTAVFHAHQQTDKGFGAAAGPGSARTLADAFRAAGYRVSEGDSPWLLGTGDQALIDELAAGFAGAVAETGRIAADVIAVWRSIRRTAAQVGHTDTLAEPA